MLADNGKSAPPPASIPLPGNGSDAFKGFNRVGREDTADELLRPRTDPGLLAKRIVLIAIVAALVIVIGFLALKRSGLSLVPTQETSGHAFAPPQSQAE